MDVALADWRFLLVLLGLACSHGGLIWAVHRHAKILNGGILGRIEKNLARLNERADTHAEDIRGLHQAVVKETDKREESIRRCHERTTKMGGK
jgi:hypothetical protein|tara:strand:+ start:212 stop:490 length:279 start_codon:yes stop_codon:yes gene_type:complete